MDSTDICPVSFSDHSAILLNIVTENLPFGPSFWKLNCSLLDDLDYIKQLEESLVKWISEYETFENKGLLWDILKFEIRRFTISYSKNKAKQRKSKIKDLEQQLTNLDGLYVSDPSTQNFERLKKVRADLDECYNYITKGAIVNG